MKIALFELEEWEREAFAGLESEHELTYRADRLTAENAAQFGDVEVVSTFIDSSIDGTVLQSMPALKFVATRSTGVNHIDTAACRERGIAVANVPSYGKNTVAEHVFALLLAISHRMITAVNRTRSSSFSRKGLKGFDLMGRTLGVVGTGDIGRHVVRIARGFGMHVLAFDLKPDEGFAADLGFRYVSLDELLARSDVVTLHVPGNEQTRDLLGSAQFGKMKKGSVLINTARGRVVNVDALLSALADGTVSAAGLDVLPVEPVIREEAELLRSYFERDPKLDMVLADHMLLRMSNVLITPHNAFNTREAVSRILDTTRHNIEAFVQHAPENLVPA